VEEAFRAILAGDAGVSGFVGDEIHWVLAPKSQKDLPYLSLTTVVDEDDNTIEGPVGVKSAVVQVDAWASAYSEAVQVYRAVKAALAGFAGTVAGTQVQAVFFEGARDLGGDEGDRRLYGRSADFRIVWAE